jgi:predicted homoserine dehydrogenase-like protein
MLMLTSVLPTCFKFAAILTPSTSFASFFTPYNFHTASTPVTSAAFTSFNKATCAPQRHISHTEQTSTTPKDASSMKRS